MDVEPLSACVYELLASRIALARIARERLGQNRIQRPRQPRAQTADRLGRAQWRQRAFGELTLQGDLARDALIEHPGQRIHVRLRAHPASLDLLRRPVLGPAGEPPPAR